MIDIQSIKRMLLPLIKGLPLILIIFITSLIAGAKYIQYSIPMYSSTTKIKLDDRTFGVSHNNLYKDFDVFSTKNKVETEVELIKSHTLIEKALEELNFDVTYSRIGKLKSTELYHNNPFTINYTNTGSHLFDKDFHIKILNKKEYIFNPENENGGTRHLFGDTLQITNAKLCIQLNKDVSNITGFHLEDLYGFKVHSVEKQIKEITSRYLDITAKDKNIPIIRISYMNASPEKAADFVNKLCDIYIEDYVGHKSFAAKKTLSFLDEQINRVHIALTTAESELERYKQKNDVVNTRQETETELRKIADMKVQLANLEMNEVAITQLNSYINSGEYYKELAPNFGFGDLVYTELVKKLQIYNDQHKELLLKYTATHPKVKNIEQKIDEIKVFIKESIATSERDITAKRQEIEKKIVIAETFFEVIPEREKKLHILEREFHLQESMYNFLSDKRMEAAIAESASISFHRILQKAEPAAKPTTPNTVLIMFVSGLLSLIGGITIIFIKELFSSTVKSKHDIEKHSATPLCGIVKTYDKNDEDIETLYASLNLEYKLHHGRYVLAFHSAISGEGKSFLCSKLAEVIAKSGLKVCLIDLNLRKPNLHQIQKTENTTGVSEFIAGETDFKHCIQPTSTENLFVMPSGNVEKHSPLSIINHTNFSNRIAEIRAHFDICIIDTPASTNAIDSISVMQQADINIYIARARFTKRIYLKNPDLIAEEHQIKGIKYLLNDAHKANNYDGNYTGSRYSYSKRPKGGISKIKRYLNIYLK